MKKLHKHYATPCKIVASTDKKWEQKLYNKQNMKHQNFVCTPFIVNLSAAHISPDINCPLVNVFQKNDINGTKTLFEIWLIQIRWCFGQNQFLGITCFWASRLGVKRIIKWPHIGFNLKEFHVKDNRQWKYRRMTWDI